MIFKIPKTNLYNSQNNLKKNKDWLPMHKKNQEYSNIFTPDQMNKLIKIIDDISDSHNIAIKNNLICELTLRYYQNLNFHPQPNLKFNASEKYIIKLKEKINYASQKSHVKRRPTATEQEIMFFKKRCRYIFTHSKKKYFKFR